MGDVAYKRGLREGMTVLGSDGRRLGRIVALRGGTLCVERGFFFPREFSLDSDAVAEVREDEAILVEGGEAAFGLRPAAASQPSSRRAPAPPGTASAFGAPGAPGASRASRPAPAERSGAFPLRRLLDEGGDLEDEDDEVDAVRGPERPTREEPAPGRKLRFG